MVLVAVLVMVTVVVLLSCCVESERDAITDNYSPRGFRESPYYYGCDY